MRDLLNVRGAVGGLLGLLYRFCEDIDPEMLEMLEFYPGKAKLALQCSVFNYDALIGKVEEAYVEVAVVSDNDASKIEEQLWQRTTTLISEAELWKGLHEQQSKELEQKFADVKKCLETRKSTVATLEKQLALLQEKLAFKKGCLSEIEAELLSLEEQAKKSSEVVVTADRELQEQRILLDRVPEEA